MDPVSDHICFSYLSPPCRPSTLDWFGNRRLLRGAIDRVLPLLSGAVLDVGCGEMPYRQLILAQVARVNSYLGLDLPVSHGAGVKPDIEWDGITMPVPASSMDSVILTEVLEHCPEPGRVLREASRVLRPGGLLFLTVPFIWPFHDTPHDEFRYTPYSLGRLLREAGFADIVIEGTGGRNAVLGVVLGLWVRRRQPTSRVHLVTKTVMSCFLWPIIWLLFRTDERPIQLGESTLTVGLCATARLPV